MSRNGDRLLTAEETAEYLATTTGTLAKWRYQGDGPPFIKIGRAVRYRASVLDRWVDAHTVERAS